MTVVPGLPERVMLNFPSLNSHDSSRISGTSRPSSIYINWKHAKSPALPALIQYINFFSITSSFLLKLRFGKQKRKIKKVRNIIFFIGPFSLELERAIHSNRLKSGKFFPKKFKPENQIYSQIEYALEVGFSKLIPYFFWCITQIKYQARANLKIKES